MSLCYSHLLIPGAIDYIPEPEKVVAFLRHQLDIGSAPLDATLKVGRPSDKPRVGINPLTGEKVSIPRRDFRQVDSIEALHREISGFSNYDVVIAGHGPVKLQPFRLFVTIDSKETEFTAPFAYDIACHLRNVLVSTSSNDLGKACTSEIRAGVFQLPNSELAITVPNAGCARFWIEFRFGKWLFPKIDKGLDLIHSEILESAVECFETSFAQGCFWA